MRSARSGRRRLTLSPQLRFIAPDDGNARRPDGGGSAARDAGAARGNHRRSRSSGRRSVPRTFARTGAIGNFYFVAQWFPKIGVLEDTGWNCHQFHAATEFFSDFGIYDVKLDVPRGWIVGATGREHGTHRHRRRHDDASLPPGGRPRLRLDDEPRLRREAARVSSIRRCRRWTCGCCCSRNTTGRPSGISTRPARRCATTASGSAPIRTATSRSIDPAWQSGAGGMEYPTLFTAGTRWLAPRRATQPESVTVHEAGHQFWYGIVATNEFEHAWMDEGLEHLLHGARHGRSVLSALLRRSGTSATSCRGCSRICALTRDTDGNRMPAFRPVARNDDQSTPTWRYWPGSASAITYNKTALWLHTLERMLGWETLQRDPLDLLSALRVQASEAAGLLRRCQRGRAART